MYKSMLIIIMKYRWNTDGFPQSMQKRKNIKLSVKISTKIGGLSTEICG